MTCEICGKPKASELTPGHCSRGEYIECHGLDARPITASVCFHDGYEREKARADKAEAERDAAVAVLRDVEWSASNGCPVCDVLKHFGHGKNCALAAVLKASGR